MLTIIIPIYNVEKYLEECLESIIKQSYTNFKAILINDGSNDNSKEIAIKYSKLDSRFIVINQNNMGLGKARNIGIEYSLNYLKDTEYIGFVDSDDVIDKNYYSILIDTLKTHNTLIAKTKNIIKFSSKIPNVKISNKNKSYIYDTTKNLAYKTEPWRGIYHISLFTKLRFPNIRNGEDVPFGICANVLAKYIAFNKNAVYFYRQHKASLSSLNANNKIKIQDESFSGFKYIYYFFHENNLLHKYTIPTDMIKPKLKIDLENPQYLSNLQKALLSWDIPKYVLNKNPVLKIALESKNLEEYLKKVRTPKEKWKQNFRIKFNKKEKIVKLFGITFFQR